MYLRTPSKVPQCVSLFRDLVAHRGRDAALVFLNAHFTEEVIAEALREVDATMHISPDQPDHDPEAA